MVFMQKEGKKKFVADALVDSYKKKGFTVIGESSSDEAAASNEEVAASKATAKKTSTKKTVKEE